MERKQEEVGSLASVGLYARHFPPLPHLFIREMGGMIANTSGSTFCDIMTIIFMQMKGDQLLIFIWQAFIDDMFHKGLILVGKKGSILVWNV